MNQYNYSFTISVFFAYCHIFHIIQPPKQKISDPDELADYQRKKRSGFEDNIRKNRLSITNWIKYAQWEESQRDIDR